MKTCSRRLIFSAGHRVFQHEGKCSQLHGHEYIATITASAPELDSLGRIIDFAILKEKVGGWIESNWDHGMIIFSEDGDALKAISSLTGNKLFILPSNPTAENIADYLLREVCPMVLKDTEVKIIKVVIEETENCSAEVSL